MRRLFAVSIVSWLIGICLYSYAEDEGYSKFGDEFATRYSSEVGYCSSLLEFIDDAEVLRDNMPYHPGVVVETDFFIIDSLELVADGKYVWAKIPITLIEDTAIIRPFACLSETDPFYTPLAAYAAPVYFFNVWIDGPHDGAGAQCALSASDNHNSMIFYETWVCCNSTDCECKQNDYIPVSITVWLSKLQNGTIDTYKHIITIQCPVVPRT